MNGGDAVVLSKNELKQIGISIGIGFVVAPLSILLRLGIEGFFWVIRYYPRQLNALIGPFWLLIPLSIGGLATGLLVYKFAPETAFGGLENTISTYHDLNGRFRRRAGPVKFLATLFTVGSGGSGGLVGPVGFIGGAFGSVFGRRFHMEEDTLKTFVLCGMAAGISAILNAPFGAAIFAVEVCYVSNIVYKRFFYVLISSVTAFYVSIQLIPAIFKLETLQYRPFFNITPEMKMLVTDATMIPWLILVAVLATVVSFFFVTLYRWIHCVFVRLHGKDQFEPLFGMVMTGLLLIALFVVNPSYVFDTIGIGVGVIQDGIDSKILVASALVILIGKLFATGFTVGAGGSGGLFAPTLMLGAMTGITLSGAIQTFIGVDLSIVLIVVGMSACLAATLNVPVAAIVLIVEIFGGEFAVPAIVGSITGFLLSRHSYLYETIRKETYGEQRYLRFTSWREE